MQEGKSFQISKHQILQAYKCVKANKGAGGIDGINFEEYEKDLKNNLYKLWNRMSSGSYFPKPVKGVEIPKKNGKMRLLGIPTIEDRIAQMVVRLTFEPIVEPIFYDNSFGYRPNRSAIDAVGITRERCWKMPWLIEFDIVGLFDNIDHTKMMKAVKWHTDEKWVILYIERFLKAPIVMNDGELKERSSGTPQGGVISPVLANLFMHYAFDTWISRKYPQNPWVRYADDGIIHCQSEQEAFNLLEFLKKRMLECGLEIHLDKTKIVYCRSDRYNKRYENESFDFLGYTFRRRSVKSKNGNFFNTFSPAVSKSSAQSFRDKIRKIRKACKTSSLESLAEKLNPIIRGWMNYFTKFCSREARKEIDYVNKTLVQWLKRKYKTVKKSERRAWRMLVHLANSKPKLFYHWEKGIKPTIG
ncbi:group II intron reverse transcriptase/maturase [Acetobacterium sp.]|uniref:group II intron reverse transcriptase/maturase n=1 Tax=Acetobacterium sp. TaxID=1872094 RepID=UPI00272743D8|nr:group II intron reverse transcriptase/maturase [Acetobacterium sp.]MDO9490686.1 group II intron reverse transcriptase/maturase [Acetobacterium sp.]